MTEPPYSPAISNSILGAIGDYAQVTQNIVQAPGQPSPHRLPPDLADFTGRTDDIQALEAVLQPGGTAAISAVNGMGGVGKSALAIHVAHRLMPQFADAQLYVDLRGQSALPLSPQAVLVQFLQALTGRDEAQLPSDVDALAGLYRSALVGQRALIVLDNARDVAQVKPLLPASATCAVLITSRQALATLAGSQRRLDLMPLAEAVDLFCRITGQADGTAVQAVVVACGRLPLAIRIAGALLQRQRGWTVEKLAAQLTDEKARLDRLHLEDLDVRASFNVSYQWLTASQQQVLALAGAVVGQDFGVPVLAAVAEREAEDIATDVDELVAAQLVEVQPASERYQLHDLVRLFVREQLEAAAQATAEARVLDWYCQQARFWNDGLDPVRCRKLAESWAEGTEQSPAELEQILPRMALNWFEAERGNWVAVMQQLGQGGRADAAVVLAANLSPFYGQRSHWSDWVTTHELAKTSAEQAGNWAGVAITLGNLGLVYASQGRWEEAISSYKQSLKTKRELGDRHGVAQTLGNLGLVYADQGRWQDAISSYEQILATFSKLGDHHGVAKTLNNLGLVYADQGRWQDAISSYEQSLETKRELGDRHGVAQTLGNLGNVYQNQGRWEDAISSYEQSLETKRELGDRHGVAQTLNNLGLVYAKQGHWEDAITSYEQSLETNRELGDRHGVAQTVNNLGLVYTNQGRWEDAIASYEQDLEIARELGDHHGVAQTLNNLGNVYRNQGRWEEAISSCEQSLEISRELGARHGVAQTLNSLGLVYASQGRWEDAISSYEQDLEISRELGDRYGIAQTLNNLGLVYASQGRWEEAISSYEQSLEISRELGARHGVAQTLGNLGSVYQNQDRWEEAISSYEQDLEISRELGDRHGVAQTLGNLGSVYAKQGRWEEAIASYEQILATFRELGDRHGEGQTLANLGLLHKNRQDRDRAKALWQEALTKLPPSSPDCSTVQQWLTALDQPQRPRFIHWWLPLVLGGFLVACLLRGQWWLAVGGVLVGAAIRWGRAFMVARGRRSR